MSNFVSGLARFVSCFASTTQPAQSNRQTAAKTDKGPVPISDQKTGSCKKEADCDYLHRRNSKINVASQEAEESYTAANQKKEQPQRQQERRPTQSNGQAASVKTDGPVFVSEPTAARTGFARVAQPAQSNRQNASVRTDEGQVPISELMQTKGIDYAKENGRATFCQHQKTGSCKKGADCGFLHRHNSKINVASQEAEEPYTAANQKKEQPQRQQERRPTQSNGHNASVRTDEGQVPISELMQTKGIDYARENGRATFCQHQKTGSCKKGANCGFLHRHNSKLIAASASTEYAMKPEEEDLLDEFNEDPRPGNVQKVITVVRHLLRNDASHTVFYTALGNLVDSELLASQEAADQVVPLLRDIEEWIGRIDLTKVNAKRRGLLIALMTAVMIRDVNVPMRVVEVARKILAEAGTANYEELCGLCTRREKEVNHAKVRSNVGQRSATQPMILEYTPDEEEEEYDYTTVLCDTSDLMDTRPKKEIHRALHPIVVDAPIRNDQRILHLKALFRVYREDYISSLRSAYLLVQQNVPPSTKLERGMLPHKVHAALRQADVNKVVQLYLSLRLTNVRIDRNHGLLYRFSIDPAQFHGRTMNWEKKLMHGNLLLLSSNLFSEGSSLYQGSIVKERDHTMRDKKHATSNVIDSIEVCLLDDMSLMDLVGSETVFSALESSTFFIPYQRVLTSLSTVIQSNDATLPLEAALLAGDTSHVPTYLSAHRTLKVGHAVALSNGGDEFDVCDPNAWERHCEPWTLEKELAHATSENPSCQHYLDESQRLAIAHMFSNLVAVIQGTPGTGKTFLGAKFANILLKNLDRVKVGPILCVCYTNHAIDAFFTRYS